MVFKQLLCWSKVLHMGRKFVEAMASVNVDDVWRIHRKLFVRIDRYKNCTKVSLKQKNGFITFQEYSSFQLQIVLMKKIP